ncbi:MAG: hypothetical protein M3Y56_05845 [Armatimonadota bacterium]|nr:hypothetical protein [Armatimonadota bacterium]
MSNPESSKQEGVAQLVAALGTTDPDSDIEWSFKSRETTDDAKHRRDLEQSKEQDRRLDSIQRRAAENRNWWLVALLFLVLAVGCFAVLILTKNDDVRKNAITGLISAFTALLGFLAGQGKRASSAEAKD